MWIHDGRVPGAGLSPALFVSEPLYKNLRMSVEMCRGTVLSGRHSPCKFGYQHLAVYENGRNERAFPADVLMLGTHCVDGRLQPC